MRSFFVDALVERAKVDPDLVLLTGDLGSGCLEKFQEQFPNRFFNLGIAEQNILSVASGLALEGKKVFIYSIANFNTLRVLEQIRNDVCYMNLDVNIISVGAGLEYGQLGFSHQATEDISCMRAIPNMSVFNPATVSECNNAVKFMFETKTPCYMRLNKKGVDCGVRSLSLHPYLVKEGKNVAIFATGTILEEALKAGEELKKSGLDVAVFSCPAIKPIDAKNVLKKMFNFKQIFTLEEHTVLGGFGGAFAEILAPINGIKPSLHILGIRDVFSGVVGDRAFMRREYKIDARSIALYIKRNLQ